MRTIENWHKRPAFKKRALINISIVCFMVISAMLAISIIPTSSPAISMSMDEYFQISYDPAVFSDTDIQGNEVFNVTINGTATCIKDLPLTVSKGRVSGRVVAQHSTSGSKVTLNPGYMVAIEPFPSDAGETTSMSVTVSLKFPATSASGNYSVIAEVISAEVKVRLFDTWTDVTDEVPPSEDLGAVDYTAVSVSPTPIPSPSLTPGPTATIVPPASSLILDIWDVGVSTWDMDSAATLMEDIKVSSQSGDITITIPSGTKALGPDAGPLPELTITSLAPLPSPPNAYTTIAAFELEPDGATFTPGIELMIAYDPDALPDGMNASSLAIAFRSGQQGTWEFVTDPVSIDTDAHTATFCIGHFTTFAILAPAGSTSGGSGALPWAISGSILALAAALILFVIWRRKRVVFDEVITSTPSMYDQE